MNFPTLRILGLASLAALLLACSDDGANDNLIVDQPEGDTAKRDGGMKTPDDPDTSKSQDETPSTETTVQEADVDTIEWKTGTDVGNGLAVKDTGNPRANNVAIIYSGDAATLENAKGWATALYKADLRDRGVRHLVAVQAPSNATYTKKEISNSKLAKMLVPQVDDKTKFVLMIGHSSGTYVAHEFLGQVAATLDPDKKLDGKIVYFDLDGTTIGFTSAIAAKVKKTYWVAPRDNVKNTNGLNPDQMTSGGEKYPLLGGTLPYEAADAGCNKGATSCVHASVVISKPHNAAAMSATDYSDFADGRTVVTKYLADKATDAALMP